MMDTWYTTKNMNEVCEHGSQRRKCIHCESIWQDKRIAELEEKLAESQARVELFELIFGRITHTACITKQNVEINLLPETWQTIMREIE